MLRRFAKHPIPFSLILEGSLTHQDLPGVWQIAATSKSGTVLCWPHSAVQETYAEVRCVTRADVLKMVVGTTAKVLGAGATVAGEISLVKSYHVFNSPSVGGVLGALPEGVDNAAGQ